jgi:hypothetical protein
MSELLSEGQVNHLTATKKIANIGLTFVNDNVIDNIPSIAELSSSLIMCQIMKEVILTKYRYTPHLQN